MNAKGRVPILCSVEHPKKTTIFVFDQSAKCNSCVVLFQCNYSVPYQEKPLVFILIHLGFESSITKQRKCISAISESSPDLKHMLHPYTTTIKYLATTNKFYHILPSINEESISSSWPTECAGLRGWFLMKLSLAICVSNQCLQNLLHRTWRSPHP